MKGFDQSEYPDNVTPRERRVGESAAEAPGESAAASRSGEEM